MKFTTQNFTWLHCKDCGERIALYPGREYDSIKCKCVPTEENPTEEVKRGRSRKANSTLQESE